MHTQIGSWKNGKTVLIGLRSWHKAATALERCSELGAASMIRSSFLPGSIADEPDDATVYREQALGVLHEDIHMLDVVFNSDQRLAEALGWRRDDSKSDDQNTVDAAKFWGAELRKNCKP